MTTLHHVWRYGILPCAGMWIIITTPTHACMDDMTLECSLRCTLTHVLPRVTAVTSIQLNWQQGYTPHHIYSGNSHNSFSRTRQVAMPYKSLSTKLKQPLYSYVYECTAVKAIKICMHNTISLHGLTSTKKESAFSPKRKSTKFRAPLAM